MKILNANNDEQHDLNIYFENQDISAICTKCYVSDNEKDIQYGWADVVIHSKNENVRFNSMYKCNPSEPLLEPLEVRIYGFIHWSIDKDSDTDEMEWKYNDLRKTLYETT